MKRLLAALVLLAALIWLRDAYCGLVTSVLSYTGPN